jgi:hypothetical protein
MILLPSFWFTSSTCISRSSTYYVIYIAKFILLEILVHILFNSIIFVLYNLYYIDQINYLDTREGLVNRNVRSRYYALWE